MWFVHHANDIGQGKKPYFRPLFQLFSTEQNDAKDITAGMLKNREIPKSKYYGSPMGHGLSP